MNCKQYKFDRLKQAEKLNPEQKQTRLMKELQAKLKLPKLVVFLLLYNQFRSVSQSAVILLNLPLALIGGVL